MQWETRRALEGITLKGSLVAFGLQFAVAGVWTYNGQPDGHPLQWISVGFGGLSLVLFGATLALGRDREPGQCEFCGGEIQGEPPEDWVLECGDCGQEWVVAGAFHGRGKMR